MSLLFHNNENKKAIFFKAYRKSLGNITMSCNAAKITRSDFTRAVKEDIKFKSDIADLDQAEIDFGESKLKERMQRGDTRAIVYFLNTKGKDRGYGEGSQVKITGSKEEPLEINGSLDVKLIQEAAIAAAAKAIDEY